MCLQICSSLKFVVLTVIEVFLQHRPGVSLEDALAATRTAYLANVMSNMLPFGLDLRYISGCSNVTKYHLYVPQNELQIKFHLEHPYPF